MHDQMTIGTFQCSVSMRVSFVLRSAEETLEMTMHWSDLKHRNDIITLRTACILIPQYIPGTPQLHAFSFLNTSLVTPQLHAFLLLNTSLVTPQLHAFLLLNTSPVTPQSHALSFPNDPTIACTLLK
jgi:hypothetical protein